MKNLFSSLLITAWFLQSSNLLAQEQLFTVSGIVLDSASKLPLAFVAIQIKDKASGQSSREDGAFSISCSHGDTLVFTRLGYTPYLVVVDRQSLALTIELGENVHMLTGITVYDKIIIQGIDNWKKDLKPGRPVKFQNTAASNPDLGLIPTFGPGIVFGFGGKDRTKKKQDDLLKTEVYRSTVNSPEVKKELMNLYSISEETYYRKLEAFNIENPAVAYLTDQREIVSMLIQFFALKEP